MEQLIGEKQSLGITLALIWGSTNIHVCLQLRSGPSFIEFYRVMRSQLIPRLNSSVSTYKDLLNCHCTQTFQ